MSAMINQGDMKPGSIYRIALENFVTYKQVELFPGPSLNMIIGPNGTGKSTFVCAIILGLCGKPSVIGRAKKVSDYIKSGCTQAVIEIELYREPGKRNVAITRHIVAENSSWFLDKKKVSEKQVQDLITSLNIQVDNLCQLLPQDRVQDFSKMDGPELLRNTLAAVHGQEAVDKLDSLVTLRQKHRNLGTNTEQQKQKLEEEQRLNARLKTILDALQERRSIEKQIMICKKKKLWVEYHNLYQKVKECDRDKKEAEKVVVTHTRNIAPFETVINEDKSLISANENESLTINREVHKLKDKIREILQTIKSQDTQLKHYDTTLAEKLELHNNRARIMQGEMTLVDKLTNDYRNLIAKVGDKSMAERKLTELRNEIQTTKSTISGFEKQKLQTEYTINNNIIPQMERCKSSIRQFENVKENRLTKLPERYQDCKRAVAWLREHRDEFMGMVCEPMFLEINFTDQRFARYLNSTVSDRDLVAFTFENKDDMNKFLRIMRNDLKLRLVNAICSQPTQARFMPPCPIEDLSYLGFSTYLVDTIVAPEPITRYLCRQYGVHRIPIGNDHTYQHSGKVPQQFNLFFTTNHRFSVKVSAYSGAKSSTTVEVGSAGLLAHTVDEDQLQRTREKQEELEVSYANCKKTLESIQRKVSLHNEQRMKFEAEAKSIISVIDKINTMTTQIKMQKNKIRDLENEPALDIEAERAKCRKAQKAAVNKQCRLHGELKNSLKELHRHLSGAQICKLKLDLRRKSVVQKETELREMKRGLHDAQVTLENIQRIISNAKSAAKEKMQEAKRACGGHMPDHPQFPYRDDFRELPTNFEELEAHIDELQSRIDCMEQGDERIVKEYEERQKRISFLMSEINNASANKLQLEQEIETIKSVWLPAVEKLLQDVNVTFASMFEKLDCGGEVVLDKSGSETDFESWGVALMVRFRAEEPLARLTRHSQSGGERALATALYLMSLQALSRVPFRCVDEINQGMDPINERKMFQLLVKVTTENDNAQYFLLTPKLLTNLEYNERIMVHTVMNGKNIVSYDKWKYQSFLRKAATYAA